MMRAQRINKTKIENIGKNKRKKIGLKEIWEKLKG